MKTVVSNTSPLRYLTCIGEQELLKHLFSSVFIPKAVFQELTHQQTPEIVRNVMQYPPEWIHIRDVKRIPDVSFSKLLQTNFKVSPSLIQALLKRHT